MLTNTSLQAFSSPLATGWSQAVNTGRYWYCLLKRLQWPDTLEHLRQLLKDRPLLLRFRQLHVLELLLRGADFSRNFPHYFPILLSDYLSPQWPGAAKASAIPEAFYPKQALWWTWLKLYDALPASLRDAQAVCHGIQETNHQALEKAMGHLQAWQTLLAEREPALHLWRRFLPKPETSLGELQQHLKAAKFFLATCEDYPTLDFWLPEWQSEAVKVIFQELERYQSLRQDYAQVIYEKGWQENADYVFRFYHYLAKKPHFFWQRLQAQALLKKILRQAPKAESQRLQLISHVIRAQQSLRLLEKNQVLAQKLFQNYWQGEKSDLVQLKAIYRQQRLLQETNFPYKKLWEADQAQPITTVLLSFAQQQAENWAYALRQQVSELKQTLRWQIKHHAYSPEPESLCPDSWPFWAQERFSGDLLRAWPYLPLWLEYQKVEKELLRENQEPPKGDFAVTWAKTLRSWAAREEFIQRYKDVGIHLTHKRWQSLQQCPTLLLWPEEDADDDWLPPFPNAYVLYLETGPNEYFILLGLPKLFSVALQRLSAWRAQTPLPPSPNNLALPLDKKKPPGLEKAPTATSQNRSDHSTKTPAETAPEKVLETLVSKNRSSPAKTNSSKKISTNKALPLIPSYETASLVLNDWPRFQDYPLNDLAKAIILILQKEAPIHQEVLLKRLRQAAGLSRCGSAVTAHIEQALLLLSERKGLRQKGNFLYLPEQRQHNIRLRSRESLDKGEKNLSWICEEELRQAWKQSQGGRDIAARLALSLQLLGFRQAQIKLKQQLAARLAVEYPAAARQASTDTAEYRHRDA